MDIAENNIEKEHDTHERAKVLCDLKCLYIIHGGIFNKDHYL